MLSAAVFPTGKSQKQFKNPSTDGWMIKMQFIYTAEYYSAMQKSGSLSVMMWIKVEMFVLGKISQP